MSDSTPPSPTSLQERLNSATSQAANAVQAITGTSQADADRSWIARQIINIFVTVIAAVLALLATQGVMTGEWGKVADQAAELIKTAVLPIVTLVLGYYFGQAGKA